MFLMIMQISKNNFHENMMPSVYMDIFTKQELEILQYLSEKAEVLE